MEYNNGYPTNYILIDNELGCKNGYVLEDTIPGDNVLPRCLLNDDSRGPEGESWLCIDKDNKDQVSEIRSIKWISKNDSLTRIRDYSDYKLQVDDNIFNFIYSNNNNIIL